LSYEIHVRRAAEVDIAEAQVWYETQQNGLGVTSVQRFRKYLIDWPRLR